MHVWVSLGILRELLLTDAEYEELCHQINVSLHQNRMFPCKPHLSCWVHSYLKEPTKPNWRNQYENEREIHEFFSLQAATKAKTIIHKHFEWKIIDVYGFKLLIQWLWMINTNTSNHNHKSNIAKTIFQNSEGAWLPAEVFSIDDEENFLQPKRFRVWRWKRKWQSELLMIRKSDGNTWRRVAWLQGP